MAIVLAPVGIVLGYIARSQIRRSGEGGAGLAKAALIIGWIFTLVPIVIYLIAAIVTATVVSNDMNNRQHTISTETRAP